MRKVKKFSKKHLTLKHRYDIISTLTIWQRIKYAGVAELADALASGASDRKVVWVQVPSPAPRQVVVIRLVFLLLIRLKNAVAELHQIFDLVEAELVPQIDALASGASDRKVVWVQVPSPAPNKNSYFDTKSAFFIFALKALFYGHYGTFQNQTKPSQQSAVAVFLLLGADFCSD